MEKYKFKIDEYGYKKWYCGGKLHRENDKSAVIWGNGTEDYWENGESVDK
jgi:hypothetical protein